MDSKTDFLAEIAQKYIGNRQKAMCLSNSKYLTITMDIFFTGKSYFMLEKNVMKVTVYAIFIFN